MDSDAAVRGIDSGGGGVVEAAAAGAASETSATSTLKSPLR